jgi:hypothetical protein
VIHCDSLHATLLLSAVVCLTCGSTVAADAQGDSLAAKLAAFVEALPGVDVEELVEREPLLLRAPDINTVLQVGHAVPPV